MEKKVSSWELRKFGFVTGFMFVLIFFLFFPWFLEKSRPMWPLYIAAPLVLLAVIFPPALKPVQKYWLKFAELLGWVNSRIILSVLFFGVFTPVGWVKRKFFAGNAPQDQKSYWIESSRTQSFEKPF